MVNCSFNDLQSQSLFTSEGAVRCKSRICLLKPVRAPAKGSCVSAPGVSGWSVADQPRRRAGGRILGASLVIRKAGWCRALLSARDASRHVKAPACRGFYIKGLLLGGVDLAEQLAQQRVRALAGVLGIRRFAETVRRSGAAQTVTHFHVFETLQVIKVDGHGCLLLRARQYARLGTGCPARQWYGLP